VLFQINMERKRKIVFNTDKLERYRLKHKDSEGKLCLSNLCTNIKFLLLPISRSWVYP
jgi:hypothetical protein